MNIFSGLVPAKTQPNKNSTDWDNVKNLFMQLGTNGNIYSFFFIFTGGYVAKMTVSDWGVYMSKMTVSDWGGYVAKMTVSYWGWLWD